MGQAYEKSLHSFTKDLERKKTNAFMSKKLRATIIFRKKKKENVKAEK